MVDSPVQEELSCSVGNELWAAIGRKFVRDAICGKGVSEYVNESTCTILCSLHYWPIGIPVDDDEVVPSLVVEEVRADTLEGVFG